MKRFAFLVFPLLCFSGPAISADLDGPVYRERSDAAMVRYGKRDKTVALYLRVSTG